MAGIYVHIPFCRSRCIYCGFFSTTQQPLQQRYVDALCRELEQRSDYLGDHPVQTIYLGGGTPSQLTAAQLQQLFRLLGSASEVTIECNPNDVTPQFAQLLSRLPVNRVSMGAQTFSPARLAFLRRRHTAGQTAQAVGLLRQAGIANISIDLMYGFPDESLADWHADIRQALSLGVEHLSAYALTYEEGTPLWQMLRQELVSEAGEELVRQMYYDLCDRLTGAGYEHYEISNFARPGFRSRHNSGYWNQTPYLGLGAAAHSFDGSSRQWNVAHLTSYIEAVEQGLSCCEREQLDADTRYNDLVMTALRTCEGLSLDSLTPGQRRYCLSSARKYIDGGLLSAERGHLRLTRDGLFVSDMVMTDLMKV